MVILVVKALKYFALQKDLMLLQKTLVLAVQVSIIVVRKEARRRARCRICSRDLLAYLLT